MQLILRDQNPTNPTDHGQAQGHQDRASERKPVALDDAWGPIQRKQINFCKVFPQAIDVMTACWEMETALMREMKDVVREPPKPAAAKKT